jgi:hypothetical protein
MNPEQTPEGAVGPQGLAALIRGLSELAAFVADHPELSLPDVEAVGRPCGELFSHDMRDVEAAAGALGVTPAFAPDGAYVATGRFGPVRLRYVARPTPYGSGESR